MTENDVPLPGREAELLSVDRTVLALFAGGSGDHNPLHIDIDFARSHGGRDDVIGHGMLTMAVLGRHVTTLCPQRQMKDFSVRFVAPTQVGDQLSCRAGAPVREDNLVRFPLEVLRQNGDVLARGSAAFDAGDPA